MMHSSQTGELDEARLRELLQSDTGIALSRLLDSPAGAQLRDAAGKGDLIHAQKLIGELLSGQEGQAIMSLLRGYYGK